MSKTFLSLQGLILAYPSLLGLTVIFGSVAPFLSGSFQATSVAEFIIGVTLLRFLISAWRVYILVLLNGPKNEKPISRAWLILCFCAITFSVLSYFPFIHMENKTSSNFIYMNSQLFVLGLYFAPTAIHVGFEWFWQNKLKAKSFS